MNLELDLNASPVMKPLKGWNKKMENLTINRSSPVVDSHSYALINTEDEIVRTLLSNNERIPVLRTSVNQCSILSNGGVNNPDELIGVLPALSMNTLGADSFRSDYGVKMSLYAGAMANGISSVDMVLALAREGILSSFGSGGLSLPQIGESIKTLNKSLGSKSYAVNLLHNPVSPDWEMECVKLFLNEGVHIIEVSAFVKVTLAIVYYRVAGLALTHSGNVVAPNKVIAKISREEVASQFMSPPPKKLVDKLLALGLITRQQHELSQRITLADDVTVEANSGGHTDGQIASCAFPSMVILRNKLATQNTTDNRVRVGLAGGIGTPQSAIAAFAMGADFIVTGSINQACIEAGTSNSVKEKLCNAKISDVMLAPSADMFEMGSKVQVLKAGTMYGLRSTKLYEHYKKYESLESMPAKEIELLEKTFFKKTITEVWDETVQYFQSLGYEKQILLAENQPRKKMALVFKWYLGQSSRWAIQGQSDRVIDFQVWCGPSMGSCNDWLSNTPLETNRKVVDLSMHLMSGASYLYKLNILKLMGVVIPDSVWSYNTVNTEHGFIK